MTEQEASSQSTNVDDPVTTQAYKTPVVHIKDRYSIKQSTQIYCSIFQYSKITKRIYGSGWKDDSLVNSLKKQVKKVEFNKIVVWAHLQSLDIGVNRSFKAHLSNKIEEYITTKSKYENDWQATEKQSRYRSNYLLTAVWRESNRYFKRLWYGWNSKLRLLFLWC